MKKQKTMALFIACGLVCILALLNHHNKKTSEEMDCVDFMLENVEVLTNLEEQSTGFSGISICPGSSKYVYVSVENANMIVYEHLCDSIDRANNISYSICHADGYGNGTLTGTDKLIMNYEVKSSTLVKCNGYHNSIRY